MERILVCGGRDFGRAPSLPWEVSAAEWNDLQVKAREQVSLAFRVLDVALSKYKVEVIIQGGAKGADALGKMWAETKGIAVDEYKVDWSKGKVAGILRNQEMLELAKPTLVIAFPGGSGTRDMVTRAKKAGVRVIEVPSK